MMRDEDLDLATTAIATFAGGLLLDQLTWTLLEGDPQSALFVLTHAHARPARPGTGTPGVFTYDRIRRVRVRIPVAMVEDLRRYGTISVDGGACLWHTAVRRARALLRFWPTPSYPRTL